MQHAAHHANSPSRWTHGMALERRMGLPRAMLVAHAPNAATMVGRALLSACLDGATLANLTHILTITVQDSVRRKT